MTNSEKTLHFLSQRGQITTTQLAKELEVSQPYASRILNDLVIRNKAIKWNGNFYKRDQYIAGAIRLLNLRLAKKMDEYRETLELLTKALDRE